MGRKGHGKVVVVYPNGRHVEFPGVSVEEALDAVVDSFRWGGDRPVSSSWLDEKDFTSAFDRRLAERQRLRE